MDSSQGETNVLLWDDTFNQTFDYRKRMTQNGDEIQLISIECAL